MTDLPIRIAQIPLLKLCDRQTKIGMLKLLTAEEKQFYTDNGYVQLGNVFSPDEVEEMSEEYDDIFERMSMDKKSRLDTIWQGDWQRELIPEDNSDSSKIVKSIHNLQFHSAIFTRLGLGRFL